MPIYISRDFVLYESTEDPEYANEINENNPVVGYKNLVLYNQITADSSAVGYPAENIGSDSTNLYWLSDSTATQYIYFEIAASGFDYMGIAGHNLAGSTIQWESRATTGDSWSNASDPVIPSNNEALMFLIDQINHPLARLKIIPSSGVFHKIAVIYIGKYLTLLNRIGVDYIPINYGRKTTVQTGFSEDGAFLGRVLKRRILESSIPQNYVAKSYYTGKIDPWAIHAQTKPFFFAWRPGQFPTEVGFCWAVNDLVPQNAHPNGRVRFDLNIRGLAPWI